MTWNDLLCLFLVPIDLDVIIKMYNNVSVVFIYLQDELERLNKASEEINRLELELDVGLNIIITLVINIGIMLIKWRFYLVFKILIYFLVSKVNEFLVIP